MLPVILASQSNARLTGKRRNKVYAKQVRKVHRAVRLDVAFTNETASASKVQPMTSFATPAERTMRPTVVSSSLSAVRIRQRTGKAVIENETPMKSVRKLGLVVSLTRRWYMAMDVPHPTPNGSSTPARDTATDKRAFRRMIPGLISRPIMKRKRHSPIFAVRDRYGSELGGKIWFVKPGTRPSAVGP